MVSVRCLLGLLIFCPPLLASARCTDDRKQKRMSEIIQKLCVLGELRPRSCMKEAENMTVVRPKIPNKKNRPLVMDWSFWFASELFQKGSTPTNWKAQELHYLRDLLWQQRQCFNSASSAAAGGGEEVETWRAFWTRLDQYLAEKCCRMAELKMCLIAVLVAFSCWSSVNGCTWMKSNFHILSNSSISHLQQACKDVGHHHGNLSLEFPSRLYSHVTQLQAKAHIVFILRTLKNVMRLYEKSGSYEKADCDQQKLQTFILDIHRQITELEPCATKIVTTDANKMVMKKMELHFKGLISHLKDTDYSASGWKDVAGMVLQHLHRLDLLAIKTKLDPSL
ncbi:hypothetical protein NFI96_021474 [Prochilodus magdalenae]|nr:hypothetical protein NFI96_021474 [Prochilodus magdalenae]